MMNKLDNKKSNENPSDDDDDGNETDNFLLNSDTMYTKTTTSKKNVSIHDISSGSSENSKKKIEDLTYQDIKNNKKDNSKTIVHQLSYNLPIYLLPSFKKLSLKRRVELLCSYHTFISKNVTCESRKQTVCVPQPKPFRGTALFSDILSKNTDKEDQRNSSTSDDLFDALISQTSKPSSYISRSGRITKRKSYCESLSSTTDTKKPKVEDNDDWFDVSKTQASTSKGVTKKRVDTECKTPTAKGAKRTNLEIMSKSSLFKDTNKNSRINKLIEGAEQKRLKDDEDDKKMELFEKTLPTHNSDDLLNVDTIPSRKRNIQTSPVSSKSKATRIRKTSETIDSKRTKQTPSASKNSQKDFDLITLADDQPTTSSFGKDKDKTDVEKIQCPICSRYFVVSEIESHASTCGESPVSSYEKCPLCNKNFDENEKREEHIQKCSLR